MTEVKKIVLSKPLVVEENKYQNIEEPKKKKSPGRPRKFFNNEEHKIAHRKSALKHYHIKRYGEDYKLVLIKQIMEMS